MQGLDQFSEDFKKTINSTNTLLQFIGGLILTIGGISSFFVSFLGLLIPAPYLLLAKCFIIYLGILLIVIKFCNIVISTKSTLSNNIVLNNTAIESFAYSNKARQFAKIIRFIFILNILTFGALTFFIGQGVKTDCIKSQNILEVLIADFSNKSADSFSTFLLNDLGTVFHDDSTINVEPLNKFLPVDLRFKIQDSLIPLLHCHNSGLVVYGLNDSNKNISCTIYIHNLHASCDSVKITDKIITIQDPKFIELNNLASQTQLVSDLIQSILFSYKCKNFESLKMLDQILANTVSQSDLRLTAYCYLLKGNDFFRLGKIDSAADNYNKGISADNTNEDLLHNNKLLQNLSSASLEDKNRSDKTKVESTLKSLISRKRNVAFKDSNPSFMSCQLFCTIQEKDKTVKSVIFKPVYPLPEPLAHILQKKITLNLVNDISGQASHWKYTFVLKTDSLKKWNFHKKDFLGKKFYSNIFDSVANKYLDTSQWKIHMVVRFLDNTSIEYDREQ